MLDFIALANLEKTGSRRLVVPSKSIPAAPNSLQFFPQVRDINAQIMRVVIVACTPNLAEKLPMRQNFAGMRTGSRDAELLMNRVT
jgi:hypothetical protein